MSKIWLIIQREYLTRVRKKSFIVTTLLAPLGFASIFIVTILMVSHDDTKRHIAVIDKSGYDLQIMDTTSLYFSKQDTSLAYMQLVYKNMNFDGILYIPPLDNLNRINNIQYFSDNQLGVSGVGHINKQLTKQIIRQKIKQANISEDVMADLNNTNVEIITLTTGDDGQTQTNTDVSGGLGYIMGILIYMVVFLYGTMVMKSVAEEKTNRIVEIIISSVKPFELMIGKIIGVGMVCLTQLFLWMVLGFITQLVIALMFAPQLAAMQAMAANPAAVGNMDEHKIAMALQALSQLNWYAILGAFVFYFIGGYLLYGALFAAVGSAGNESDDMQSLTVVIAVPIVIAMTMMASVMKDPNSNISIWGSMIPLTSPIIMMARIPFHPPAWQVILSMILLIGGIAFNTWVAGRIYRVGILMHGKKVTIKEIGKWMFYK